MISEVERYIYSGSEKPTPPTNSKTPSPAEKYLYRKKPPTLQNIEKPFFTPSLLEEFEKRKKEIEEKFGETLTKGGFLKLLLEKSYLIFEENGGSVKKDKNNGGNNGNGGNGSTPGLEEKDKELLKTIKPRRRNKCKECGGAIINDPNGGRVCDKCGVFVSEGSYFDFREKPNYTMDMRESKSSYFPTNITSHNKGIGTVPPDLKNLKTKFANSNTLDHKERTLKDIIIEISRFSSLLNLKREAEKEAVTLIRLYLKNNSFQGSSIELYVICFLYLAVRKLQTPISFKKMSEVSNIKIGKIYKLSMKITKELNLKIPPITPEGYIPGICSQISYGIEIENRAKELLKYIKNSNPMVIATVAVYGALREIGVKFNQEEITKLCGISVHILRSGYKELEKNLKAG